MPISPPNEHHSQSFNLDNKISPTILLIIVILSIIFFILGLVHLLIRLLIKPTQNNQEDLLDHVTVLQGQLQQLFHLHDSGVDQSYIDTLPVFYYKSIIGLKDPFDCAVCLCEFELNDRLRLLPKCSHAFHMECIDTWLLSHSTCPLCRSSLLLEYGNNHNNSNNNVNGYSPIVCVLESGSSVENSREIGRELSSLGQVESGSGQVGFFRKSCDERHEEEKIVVVKLGKFRNVDIGEGSSENNYNNNNTVTRLTADTDTDTVVVANDNNDNGVSGGNDDLGSRRCFSMGSFAYVLDETTSLQVPIRNTPIRKQTSKKPSLPLKPGYRVAMSEYGCDSRGEFNGIDAFKAIDNLSAIDIGGGNNGKSHLHAANVTERSRRRESFSISRIWSRKGNGNESSRRTNSEIEVDVSELGGDEETQSCYSVDSIVNPNTTSTSSSTRRTLLWLMGRQNKIVFHKHSNSMSSNT